MSVDREEKRIVEEFFKTKPAHVTPEMIKVVKELIPEQEKEKNDEK